MSRGPELAIQDSMVKWLNANRILNWRISSTTMSNFPDLLCLYKGKFVAIEVKRDTKTKARQGQLKTIEIINQFGGHATVVGSLEQLKEFFSNIDGGNE